MKGWIRRFYEESLPDMVVPGKVFTLYGPRRSGKTSLVKSYLDNRGGRIYSGTGDDLPLQELFSAQSVQRMRGAFSGYDLIFIDEAQRIPEIGMGLKIIVDNIPELSVIATGSSSFELSNRLGEPLTGRQKTALLYPVSVMELMRLQGGMEVIETLEEMLVFGSYPEVLTAGSSDAKRDYLATLRDTYLYRDILVLENLRNSDKLMDLLRLVAFQIGRDVSLSELGLNLGLSVQTVEKYLDLLEKSFVLKRVRGFSRNLRKEITKSSRYYFLDNGVRNAVISNFNPLKMRNDVGMLWENFLFAERMKTRMYRGIQADQWFWRTYDKKEIDLIEEREGKLFGYEFKWGGKHPNAPKGWLETYPEAEFLVVNRDNFLQFLE